MGKNVALIIFYDKDKRILLQNRRGISNHNWDWGFFGGEIEEGETPEQAVVRETKEELCFDLKNFKFVRKYNAVGIFGDFYVFISPLGNISDLHQKEGQSMKLFSLEETENLNIGERNKTVIRGLKKILHS